MSMSQSDAGGIGEKEKRGIHPERADPMQIDIYRRMTPEQKWDVAGALYDTARKLTEAGERMRHPDWTDEQVQRAVSRRMLLAGD
jgi:hypothetical protein